VPGVQVIRTWSRDSARGSLHGATPARVRILIYRWIVTRSEVRGRRACVSQRSSRAWPKKNRHRFPKIRILDNGDDPSFAWTTA